jgi:hypothetical protein
VAPVLDFASADYTIKTISFKNSGRSAATVIQLTRIAVDDEPWLDVPASTTAQVLIDIVDF